MATVEWRLVRPTPMEVAVFLLIAHFQVDPTGQAGQALPGWPAQAALFLQQVR